MNENELINNKTVNLILKNYSQKIFSNIFPQQFHPSRKNNNCHTIIFIVYIYNTHFLSFFLLYVILLLCVCFLWQIETWPDFCNYLSFVLHSNQFSNESLKEISNGQSFLWERKKGETFLFLLLLWLKNMYIFF